MADIATLGSEIKEMIVYDMTFIRKDENARAVRKTLEENGAVVVRENPLVKIGLDYPIKNKRQGYLGVLQFAVAETDGVSRIDRALALDVGLLRKLIIRVGAPAVENKPNKVLKENDIRRKTESEPRRVYEPILTNEALEKKIEEILK